MVPIYRCANSFRTPISPFAVIGVGCETRGGQGSASIEGQAGRRVLTHGPWEVRVSVKVAISYHT